ncbi:hypothetical protein BGX38DRAFT_1197608 [Terfezia claveryi]|nr:hypothetical protein BGX38DRAFT_1197608 [Terfezia claveryi]
MLAGSTAMHAGMWQMFISCCVHHFSIWLLAWLALWLSHCGNSHKRGTPPPCISVLLFLQCRQSPDKVPHKASHLCLLSSRFVRDSRFTCIETSLHKEDTFKMRYALAILPLPLLVVNAHVDPATCFQDCANKCGFNCPGLDIPCYCNPDNGLFVPKFVNCLKTNCPAVYTIANSWIDANSCPPSTNAPTIVVEVTATATHTFSGEETVAATTTVPVAETNTATLTTTTTNAVGNMTVTGSGTFITTLTGSTNITSPITTVLGTSTIVNSTSTSVTTDATTITATNDGNILGANKWSPAMALGLAGIFAL